MKKLLSNRYAVVAMAIGMALFWGHQIQIMFAPGGVAAGLWPTNSMVDSDAATDTTGASAAAVRVTGPPNELTIAPLPSRDPFAPPVIAVARNPTLVSAATAAEPASAPPAPVLNALLVTGSNAKIAVIDGQMARVGDAVNGHKVIAINADTVALQEADGPTIIVLKKPATALP